MAELREIRKVIIHCSDSPDNRPIGFSQIDAWHKERGFDGVDVKVESNAGTGVKRIYCGYHYIVKRDGGVDIGRPEWAIGAHCRLHNSDSIGICWAGRFSPSDVQLKSLHLLIKQVCLKYALPYHRIYGHKEFNKQKTCPNLDMDMLRQKVRALLEGDSYGIG